MKKQIIEAIVIVGFWALVVILVSLYAKNAKSTDVHNPTPRSYKQCVDERDNLLYQMNRLEHELEQCYRRCDR